MQLGRRRNKRACSGDRLEGLELLQRQVAQGELSRVFNFF